MTRGDDFMIVLTKCGDIYGWRFNEHDRLGLRKKSS